MNYMTPETMKECAEVLGMTKTLEAVADALDELVYLGSIYSQQDLWHYDNEIGIPKFSPRDDRCIPRFVLSCDPERGLVGIVQDNRLRSLILPIELAMEVSALMDAAIEMDWES